VVRKADVFRQKQGINLLTGHRVTHIDPVARSVSGTRADGRPFEAAYAKLMIATGAAPIMPDVPGGDLPGVLAVKTLEDGRRIKAFIREKTVKRVGIIGMGYIALEMCENLRTLGIDVAMVKPNPRFLPWLHEDLAGVVRQSVESNGVRVGTGQAIRRIEPTADGYRIVCTDMSLDCGLVLVGIGVRPCSRIAETAGIATGPGNAIAVDRFLRTSDDHVYAAGDCADAYHVVTGQKTWIPLALRANRAGWAVADNVCGQAVELDGVAGTAVFRVFDMEVARTGLNAHEAVEAGFEPVEVAIKTRSRAHGHSGSGNIHVNMVGDKKSGRLLGVQMVGTEGCAHRINAPAVALHAGMSVSRFSQTDLSYAPPFGPTWDPCLTAANQLLKKL
jgi:NADPH-dependent 2,4-dienoyl-CoA reductase/sulfur reductase-like enzyme